MKKKPDKYTISKWSILIIQKSLLRAWKGKSHLEDVSIQRAKTTCLMYKEHPQINKEKKTSPKNQKT